MNLHTMYKAGMITASASDEVEEVQPNESGFQNRQTKKKHVKAQNSGNTKSTTATTTSNNTYTAIQTVAATAVSGESDSARISQSQTPPKPEPPGKPPMSPAVKNGKKKKPRSQRIAKQLTPADYAADGLNAKEIAEEERRRRRKKPPLLESPFEELCIPNNPQLEDDDVSFITMPKSIRDDKDVTGKRVNKQTIGLGEHIQRRNSRKAPSISTSADTDNMANLMKLNQPPVNNPMVKMSDDEEEEGVGENSDSADQKASPFLGNPTQKSLMEDVEEDDSLERKESAHDPQWETAMKRNTSTEIDLAFDPDAEELVGVHPQDKKMALISPQAGPPQRVTSVEEGAIQTVKEQMNVSRAGNDNMEDIHVVLPMHTSSDNDDDHEDMSSISQSHTHKRTLSTDSPLMPPFAPGQDKDNEEIEQPQTLPKDPPPSFDENEEPSESNAEEEEVTESQRDEDDPRPPTSKKKRKKKKKKPEDGTSPKKKKKKKKKKKVVDGEVDPSSPKKRKKKKKKKAGTSTKSMDKDNTASNDDPPPTPKPNKKPVSESTAATSEDLTSRTTSSKGLLSPFSWKGRKSYNHPNRITMAGVTESAPGRILEENHPLNDDDAIVNAMARSSMGASVDGSASTSPHPVRKRLFRFGKSKNHQHDNTNNIDTSTGSGVMSVQKSDHRPKQRKWYAPMKLKTSALSFKRRKNKPAEDAFKEMTTAATGNASGVRSMSTMENVAAVAAVPSNDTNKADIDFLRYDSEDADSLSEAKPSLEV